MILNTAQKNLNMIKEQRTLRTFYNFIRFWSQYLIFLQGFWYHYSAFTHQTTIFFVFLILYESQSQKL